MVNKTLCVLVVAVLLSHPAYAASDWKHVSGNVDMKRGNVLQCGDYTLKLIDFSVADRTVLLEIVSSSGEKEIAIVPAGSSHLFGDDNYKVTFVNYKNKKINVAIYMRLRPVFRIETETNTANSLSYTHITSVTFECKEKTAVDAVIEFECKDVKLNGKLHDVKIGTCAVGSRSKATIKYTPLENASIIAKVVYKDATGKKYKQCIDVVSNLPVVAETNEVTATKDTVTVKKTTNEDTYKRIFIRAIDVAIIRITFTDEQKKQLMDIRNSLEGSL